MARYIVVGYLIIINNIFRNVEYCIVSVSLYKVGPKKTDKFTK